MKSLIAAVGTAFGLSSILIGWTPAVWGQETPQSVAPDSETTLSGDSLQSVEGRTIDSDYLNSIGPSETAGNSARGENRLSEEFRLKLNSELQFITTPSDAQRLANPVPPKTSDSGTEAGVQLQLGL
ncbi:MAG: hypothetical protein MUE44_00425 [Oscillatoriaceae cyanobacterium Prado104]|jgi:hypothetical protein|nr:hypothetical protein [Oscillatoriaceae cyanobacterium Prado104]